MNTYWIQFLGRVDLDELNGMSPHQMALVQVDGASTQVSICTDQSGLIGLLRHLHSLGYTFEQIQRLPAS